MPYQILQCPIVLIHGFGDIPSITGTWLAVANYLNRHGIENTILQISPVATIEKRSEQLIKEINEKYPDKTVHLFGHSMGGLNARDIASRAKTDGSLGFKVMTVTTFGTPHRGLRILDDADQATVRSTNWFANITRKIFGLGFSGEILALKAASDKMINDHVGAIDNLTFSYLQKNFNTKARYNPEVQYFSWAGKIDLPSETLVFWATFPFSRYFGPTDGLVNVSSATWGDDLGGKGTHLGTIPGLDRAAIIGEQAVRLTIPHLQAAERGETVQVVPINTSLWSQVQNSLWGNFGVGLDFIRAMGQRS